MMDKRYKLGRKLTKRLNRQTVLDNMPKIYFVHDPYNDKFRVGRTDWPGDIFELVEPKTFEAFKSIMERLSYSLLDKTHEPD